MTFSSSDRSGGGTSKRLLNDNAEATASTDDSNEGHELLPRKYKSDNFWIANEHGISEIPRVARLCRRNKDLRDVNQVSVNQLVQGTIRK